MNAREHWVSRVGFVLAAAGSAVGLGNVWKFPYMAGTNGGGAFVLVYLLAVAGIGVPLMTAELLLGRRAQRDPVGAFRRLAPGTGWVALGWLGVGSGFLILSYYSVVGGWTLEYILRSLRGDFGEFRSLVTSPWRQLLWHGVFMLGCALVVGRGVSRGIERGNEVLMPLLFLLLVALCVDSLRLEGAARGLAFLLRPAFGQLSPRVALQAMGQAFFSLSLGMGAMITYGSYLRGDTGLIGSALKICALDTLVALLAGVVIFPIVFTYGLAPQGGPGLIFSTLPLTFQRMPLGRAVALMFFALLAFAAFTSAISLLEVEVAYLIDERGWTRWRAALGMGAAIFLAGVPSACSLRWLDALDQLATNWLLPLGGLGVACFSGWVLSGEAVRQELGPRLVRPWRLLVRYLAPLGVGLILLQGALGGR